ncbi:TIGR02444 family protein [Fodinicurvata fenggangensis]|uniref:TIGR02444 family protein n=1 Tax=Fodinicurvata fenggangensis TaxID=1121830 RepID=UPI00068CEB16|nr:TIGR02444 family protein [Fodinicurvata fenggangensis]
METEGLSFWDFSLAFYERPPVAQACLALQDDHGQDVNMVLFCFWAAGHGKVLQAADLEKLVHLIAPWQEHVVQPLREVRRWMKRPELLQREDSASLREAIKQNELEAERLQQTFLQDALDLSGGKPGLSDKKKAACAAASLEALFSSGAPTGAEERGKLGDGLLQAYRDFLQS